MKKLLLAFVLFFGLFGFTNVYAAEAINEITVTGITEPTIGKTAAEAISSIQIPDGANYTITEMTWWESENGMYFGPMSDDTTFQNDYAYRFDLVLTPNDGFEFPADEDGFYTGGTSVSDITAEMVTVGDDGTLYVGGEVIIIGDITYKVTEGAGQTVNYGEEAKFVIDADVDLFDEDAFLIIDEEQVNPANYSVSAGSTVITLHKEYIESLDEGEHSFFAVFNNMKYAETTFNVAKNNTEITPPNTGVNSKNNNLFYISIILLGSLSVIGLKKRYN